MPVMENRGWRPGPFVWLISGKERGIHTQVIHHTCMLRHVPAWCAARPAPRRLRLSRALCLLLQRLRHHFCSHVLVSLHMCP